MSKNRGKGHRGLTDNEFTKFLFDATAYPGAASGVYTMRVYALHPTSPESNSEPVDLAIDLTFEDPLTVSGVTKTPHDSYEITGPFPAGEYLSYIKGGGDESHSSHSAGVEMMHFTVNWYNPGDPAQVTVQRYFVSSHSDTALNAVISKRHDPWIPISAAP